LWTRSLPLLLLTLTLAGAQSAFFGPVKYAILPQHLRPNELVSGNGWVQLGTFVAIMVGTVLGGLTMSHGPASIATVLLAIAVAGWACARAIPPAPSADRATVVRLSVWRPTLDVLRLARRDRHGFDAILGNSWFWLYGAMLLALLPAVGAEVLGGTPTVVTALLVCFSIGIAAGSVVCERVCRGGIELGLVAVGALLSSGFGLHLAWTLAGLPTPENTVGPAAVDVTVWIDLMGLGLGSGLFIVPLNAIIQQRAEPRLRSRIIAANNVVNALFVVVSSVVAIGLTALGLSAVGILAVLMIANAIVAVVAYTKLPDRTVRLVISGIVRVMYRFRAPGIERLPQHGGAVLVCNHISFVDALLIGAASRRPVRFVMDHRIFRTPGLHWLFRTVGAIPIAPRHVDAEIYDRAFERVAETLAAGELLCIFPEGKITHTGQMNEFRRGVERIVATTPVPVIPMALHGLWGSMFSRRYGPAMKTLPRRFRARVQLRCGTPVPPESVCASDLHQRVTELLDATPPLQTT
ncbi:MAG: MFS transporter, partial [Deltaproteobacteria bacterium]|nr:MFS transporter [Deltaproteobacteria bacterium]